MGRVSGYTLDAMTSDAAFNATFTVYRATETINDSGGLSKAWGVVASGSGRAREYTDAERLANDVRKDMMMHKLYCEPTLDVQRGDVIVVNNAPAGGSEMFLVIHPHLPDNVLHHFEIKAKSFLMGSSETPMGFGPVLNIDSRHHETLDVTEHNTLA